MKKLFKKKEVINSSKLMIAAGIVVAALLLGWFIGSRVIDTNTDDTPKPSITNGVVHDVPSRG